MTRGRRFNPNQPGYGLYVNADGTMEVAPVKPDFTLTDHGSLVAVKPMNDAARDWIDENVGGVTSWWCGALMVERRYADDLLNGILGAGFEIEQS